MYKCWRCNYIDLNVQGPDACASCGAANQTRGVKSSAAQNKAIAAPPQTMALTADSVDSLAGIETADVPEDAPPAAEPESHELDSLAGAGAGVTADVAEPEAADEVGSPESPERAEDQGESAIPNAEPAVFAVRTAAKAPAAKSDD